MNGVTEALLGRQTKNNDEAPSLSLLFQLYNGLEFPASFVLSQDHRRKLDIHTFMSYASVSQTFKISQYSHDNMPSNASEYGVSSPPEYVPGSPDTSSTPPESDDETISSNLSFMKGRVSSALKSVRIPDLCSSILN